MLSRTALRGVRVAQLSTSASVRAGVADSVKNAAKKVDRTVSDAAVSGIDAGAKAADKVKEATGYTAKDAKADANELAGKAKGTAHELKGKAKGTAEEIKGKMD